MNHICPQCGKSLSRDANFCPTCGNATASATPRQVRPLESPLSSSAAKKWKLTALISAIFAVIFGVSSFNNTNQTPTSPAQPSSLATGSSLATETSSGNLNSRLPLLSASQTALPDLTSAQHLAEARRAFTSATTSATAVSPDAAKVAELFAAARWQLAAINAQEPEYKDAQKLLADIKHREQKTISVAKEKAAKPSEKQLSTALASDDEEAADSASDSSDEYVSSPLATAAPRSVTPSSSRATAPASSTVPNTTSTGGSGGDGYINSVGRRVPSPVFSSAAPDGATARCGDGSYSFSQSRRGTCSHHGGVASWLN